MVIARRLVPRAYGPRQGTQAGAPFRGNGRAGVPRPRPGGVEVSDRLRSCAVPPREDRPDGLRNGGRAPREAEPVLSPGGVVPEGLRVLPRGRRRPREEGRVHDDAPPRGGSRLRAPREGPHGDGLPGVLEGILEPPRRVPRVRRGAGGHRAARVRGGARGPRPNRRSARRLSVRVPGQAHVHAWVRVPGYAPLGAIPDQEG